MGTLTYAKPSPKGTHLQIQAQEIPSFLKHDGNPKQVYGRGTGRDAAVETLDLPPTRPVGHNTIGTGNDHCETKLER